MRMTITLGNLPLRADVSTWRFPPPHLCDWLVTRTSLVNLLLRALRDLLLRLDVIRQGFTAADDVDGVFVFEDVAFAV